MAAYFAVGAPFTHDGTTNHYATTTGGTATVAAPTSADTVTVDTNSGTGTIGFSANLTCSTFTMNNVNITLSPGAQTITVATAWTWTNGTLTPGSSQITMTGAGTFAGGGKTYNNFTANANGTVVTSGTNTFNNFTRNTTAISTWQLNGNQTINGALSLSGSAANVRLWISGAGAAGVIGTTTTLALGTTGTVSTLSNGDFSDINVTGTATPISGTSVGDANGNSGITFTTPVSRFWVGNTGSWSQTAHWSTSSGGASGASAPLPHDTITFDASSISLAAQTITMDMRQAGRTVDFSAVTNTPTLAGSTTIYYMGDVTFGTMNSTSTAAFVLFGRGSQIVTTNGYQHNSAYQVTAPGGTYTPQDNLVMSGNFTVLMGGFDANVNNPNVTAATFAFSNTNTRSIKLGNGIYTATGTGIVFNNSTVTGLTWDAGTSTIVVSNTSVTSKTISNGGTVATGLYNLTVNGSGTGAILMTVNTVINNNFTINGPKTWTITSGRTITVGGLFSSVGTTGNVVTINTATPGSRATLNLGMMGTATFTAFQDIYANANMIDATNNGTDNGNNLGVIFSRTENRYEGMLGVGN